MGRPDFSGTWHFDPVHSVLQIAAPESTVLVLEHAEPRLRIARTHTIAGRQDSFALQLTTDGREVSTEHGDLHLRARAYWEGDVLVFDTVLSRGGQLGTNVVHYVLEDDGATLRAFESLRSAALNYDNVWVMCRARPG